MVGLRFLQELQLFSSPCVQTDNGAHPTSYQWALGVKRLDCQADHSFQSSTKVNNTRSSISATISRLHSFMLCKITKTFKREITSVVLTMRRNIAMALKTNFLRLSPNAVPSKWWLDKIKTIHPLISASKFRTLRQTSKRVDDGHLNVGCWGLVTHCTPLTPRQFL